MGRSGWALRCGDDGPARGRRRATQPATSPPAGTPTHPLSYWQRGLRAASAVGCPPCAGNYQDKKEAHRCCARPGAMLRSLGDRGHPGLVLSPNSCRRGNFYVCIVSLAGTATARIDRPGDVAGDRAAAGYGTRYGLCLVAPTGDSSRGSPGGLQRARACLRHRSEQSCGGHTHAAPPRLALLFRREGPLLPYSCPRLACRVLPPLCRHGLHSIQMCASAGLRTGSARHSSALRQAEETSDA